MIIKDIDFSDNPIILAPMAGVSDVGFRALASSFGADATVTEMLSARAMAHNPKKTEYMTLTTDEEKIIIAQIFGHEEDYMQMAVKSPLLSKFQVFDINMGCPAPKIVKNGDEITYTKSLMEERKIEDKLYFYPIANTELFKNGNLKQNSGW